MLPVGVNTSDVFLENEEQQNTQTFGITLPTNIIVSKIDGLDALRQSIYLKLSIEADQYIIYPYTYGIKLLDLFGMPSYYVVAVLPNRIKEALMDDDRITDISDFEFEVNKNKVYVKFVVHSIYGDTDIETAVTY